MHVQRHAVVHKWYLTSEEARSPSTDPRGDAERGGHYRARGPFNPDVGFVGHGTYPTWRPRDHVCADLAAADITEVNDRQLIGG